MNAEWKLAPVEPTEEMSMAGSKAFSFSVSRIYAAMLEAAPQPPSAGGEVEVLGWRVNDYNFNSEAFALDYAKWAEDKEPVRYLVDRQHVTTCQQQIAAQAKENEVLRARVAELEESLRTVISDLFYQLEPKHGPKAAREYPSIVKANAALAQQVTK